MCYRWWELLHFFVLSALLLCPYAFRIPDLEVSLASEEISTFNSSCLETVWAGESEGWGWGGKGGGASVVDRGRVDWRFICYEFGSFSISASFFSYFLSSRAIPLIFPAPAQIPTPTFPTLHPACSPPNGLNQLFHWLACSEKHKRSVRSRKDYDYLQALLKGSISVGLYGNKKWRGFRQNAFRKEGGVHA